MAETNPQLDAFLAGGTPAAPEPAPEPHVEPAAAPEPKPEAAAAKPATEPPKPDEPDEEPPEPREGEAVIPRRAFEAIRHERQDWKAKAVAAETTLAELRKQLEEAKRPPEPPPQPQYQPPPEIPNPAHDPQGYHQFIVQTLERERQERARDQINHMLNLSERDAIKEHGKEKVEAMKAEFLEARNANPQLGEQLIRQPDPYGWAMAEIEKIRMQREIGDDPAAYRERVRAEAIAEFQKNGGDAPPPRVSPAAGMAPSLANVRSVAGRSAPSFTGPPSLDDIVAQIHRKS